MRNLHSLLIATGLLFIYTTSANAGFLQENLRLGLNSYSYSYGLSQSSSYQSSQSQLNVFDSFEVAYDSRYNLYGEGKISLKGVTSKTLVGVGYFISPIVALGSDFIFAAQSEAVEVSKNQSESNNLDIIINPYSRLILKVNSRLKIDLRPGVLVAYIRSNSDATSQSAVSHLYKENRPFGLIEEEQASPASKHKEGYIGVGMKLSCAVNYEISPNIFYRGSLGVGFLSGRDSVSIDGKETDRELTHLNFNVNFAQLVYQF